MSLRIALVVEESAGARLLRALTGPRHEIILVVTAASEEDGAASVAGLALDRGIEVVRPGAIRSGELGAILRDRGCDLLLNAHSLHILPAEVLEAPKLGGYNLHPGPLPEMAGLNVPSWAIFLEHDQHGVTVHRMDPGIDTGPVAYQERFPLDADDTAFSVMARCVRAGVPLMLELVETAVAGKSVPAAAQDLSERRYYDRGVPNDGWIDWGWPVSRIEAFGRACDYGPFPSPWGKPKLEIGARVLEAGTVEATGRTTAAPVGTIVASGPEEIEVAASDGTLSLRQLRADGRPVSDLEIPDGTRVGVWDRQ